MTAIAEGRDNLNSPWDVRWTLNVLEAGEIADVPPSDLSKNFAQILVWSKYSNAPQASRFHKHTVSAAATTG